MSQDMTRRWKYNLEVPVEMVEHSPLNANKMTKVQFNRLKENIKNMGMAGTLTAALKKDGKFVLISGNHRFKAMVELGYRTVPITFVEWEELRDGERQALQHSMNSVHGEADKNILRQLLDEVQDIEFREMMFVDLNDIKPVDLADLGSIVPISEHYSVKLILYSDDKRNLEELLDIVKESQNDSEMIILANGKGLQDEMLDTLSKVKGMFQIKSASVAFGKILELANKSLKAQE